MPTSILLHGLADERKRLRLSQRGLAFLAGVAYNSVHYAEHGNPVRPETAEKIQAALQKAHDDSQGPLQLQLEEVGQ